MNRTIEDYLNHKLNVLLLHQATFAEENATVRFMMKHRTDCYSELNQIFSRGRYRSVVVWCELTDNSWYDLFQFLVDNNISNDITIYSRVQLKMHELKYLKNKKVVDTYYVGTYYSTSNFHKLIGELKMMNE